MSFFNKVKKVFHTEDENDEYNEQEREQPIVRETVRPEVHETPVKKGGRTKPFTFPLVERETETSKERVKWEERILCTDDMEGFVPRPLYENERWPGKRQRTQQQASFDRQLLRRKKETKSERKHQVNPTSTVKQEERPTVKPSVKEERKPFKLSDVPSPIYGYQQPILTLQELENEPLPLKEEWQQKEDVERRAKEPTLEDDRPYDSYKEQTVPYVKKLQARRVARSMNDELQDELQEDASHIQPALETGQEESLEQPLRDDRNSCLAAQETDAVVEEQRAATVHAPPVRESAAESPLTITEMETLEGQTSSDSLNEESISFIQDEVNNLKSEHQEEALPTTILEDIDTQNTEQEKTSEEEALTSSLEEREKPYNSVIECETTIEKEAAAEAHNEKVEGESMDWSSETQVELCEEISKDDSDESAQLVETEEQVMSTESSERIKEDESDQPSTIPFNVVMLKSDKEKLNKREMLQHQATQLEKLVERAQEDDQEEMEEMATEIVISEEPLTDYQFPSLDYLTEPSEKKRDDVWLDEQAEILEETLAHFNIQAKVEQAVQGPSVTRFELTMERGTKVSKIRNLTDDLKLALAARDIRIEAPIPGTSFIGIEIPNRESHAVELREILESEPFQNSESPLEAALGLDITGEPITIDLSEMPHGLIAGATGSGKSVCINCILTSLLYKASPDELKLLLIDPKMVELAPYNGIAHLLSPVITDVKAATLALKWAVNEMEERYQLFAQVGARNIERYNEMAKEDGQAPYMPYLLIVIDELADLMMMAPQDVELSISRIAQKARAAGIHLLIATQRPSVDVITGTIKANVPTRIAFSVSSQIDSRTILDQAGAERLLGRGDMLYAEGSAPVRLQGAFVSDAEIERIIDHVKRERDPQYAFGVDDLMKIEIADERDPLFEEVCAYLIDQETASTSALQRQFNIGYNRAARIMEQLEELQFISEQNGTKPRAVFLTEEQLSRL